MHSAEGGHEHSAKVPSLPLHLTAGMGLLLLLSGLLMLILWHLRSPGWLQLVASSPPMQYHTGLCTLVAGAGVLALRRNCLRCCLIVATLLTVFGLVSLYAFLSKPGFDLPPFLIIAPSDIPGYIAKPAPVTSLAFLLCGLALAANAQPRLSARIQNQAT